VTSDVALMAKIRQNFSPFIKPAIEGTPYPESFLAALVANESGGDLAAGRFEPGVFWELSFTFTGRKTAFGSITTDKLKEYLGNGATDKAVAALINLATSAGPTQIMGYQSLARGYPLAELYNLATHFKRAIEILDDFRKQFDLVPVYGETYDVFFRCWNTGRPDGKTFDPNYVPNGLLRMQIYGA
jgi:hypothetical protein